MTSPNCFISKLPGFPIPHFFRRASQRFITCISDRPTTTPHSKPALESDIFNQNPDINGIVTKSTYEFFHNQNYKYYIRNLVTSNLWNENRWSELENQTCLGRDIDISGFGKQHSGFLSIRFSAWLFFVNVGVLLLCIVFPGGFNLQNKRKDTTTKNNKPTEQERDPTNAPTTNIKQHNKTHSHHSTIST